MAFGSPKRSVRVDILLTSTPAKVGAMTANILVVGHPSI
jgi:hypothetical protein